MGYELLGDGFVFILRIFYIHFPWNKWRLFDVHLCGFTFFSSILVTFFRNACLRISGIQFQETNMSLTKHITRKPRGPDYQKDGHRQWLEDGPNHQGI